MSISPVVSVLMTAFNRERYIAEAIESVQASSFVNFELIIVDDGSTDNTVAIAKDFANGDARIKLYINEKNLGDYPNRNKAASYAAGKYLKFVDSDDRIYPGTLQTMVEMMNRFEDAGWGISIFYDEPAGVNYPFCLNSKAAYEYHYFNKPIFFASPSSVIFTKDAFNAVGGFPEKRMVSDFEMWHKLSLQFSLILMPPALVWTRTHPEQEMNDHEKYVLEYEQIKLDYITHQDSPLTGQQVSLIKKRRRTTVFKIFVRKLLQLNFKAAKPRLKVFLFYLGK